MLTLKFCVSTPGQRATGDFKPCTPEERAQRGNVKDPVPESQRPLAMFGIGQGKKAHKNRGDTIWQKDEHR